MANCATFCAASIPMKIGYIIVLVSFVLALTAFAAPVWFEFTYDSGSKESGTQGLWTHCYWSSDYTCCATVTDFFDTSTSNTPDWMYAVRVMMAISLVTGLVTIFAMSIQTCSLTASKGIGIFVIVICFATGSLLSASLITYAVGIKDNDWSSKADYSYSFYACLFSGGGYLVAGILAILSVCCLCCASSVEPKK